MKRPQPVSIIELFERRRAIADAIKLLEEEDHTIKQRLEGLIPENGEVDGIIHTVATRKNVCYSKYSDFILDKFVAANRRATASAMIDNFTSETKLHYIKAKHQ